jgi:hypothetical protein
MRKHRGYLLEIPLIMIITGIVLVILVPLLPEIASGVLVIIGTAILIGGFYYVIVIPGWQPNLKQLKYYWKIAIFASISLLIMFMTLLYLIN